MATRNGFYENGLWLAKLSGIGRLSMGMQIWENSGNRKKLVRNAVLTIVMSFFKATPLACVKQQKSLKLRSKVFSTTAVRKVRTNRKLLSVYCKGWIYKEQAIDYLLGYITQPICAILSPSCWLSAHSFNPLVVVDLCIMKKCFECNTDQIGHVRGAIITGCYTRV